MSTDRPSTQHLSPEEAFSFVENTLSRGLRRSVETHLDSCDECVEYLASVLRLQCTSDSEGESKDEVPGNVPRRSSEELLHRLRPHIIASSPGKGGPRRFGWVWNQWVPAAVAAAVLILGFVLIQQLVLTPARGLQLATRAITELVTLRQGTGRIPLRYVPGFHRARVTRSGFDAVDPIEEQIEAYLRKAVELAPREVESQTALGLYLLDKGALEEAETRLQKALEIEPESLAAKNALAVVYYENALRDSQAAQGFLRRGLALLREAQRQHPEDVQITFNMGMFYQQLGFEDRARLTWSNYLKLDPDSEWAEVAMEKLDELGES